MRLYKEMSNLLLAPSFGKIYVVLFITLQITLIQSKEIKCYQPNFVESVWTDTPMFSVNMTFTAQGTITSITTVKREIAAPIVAMALAQNYEDGKSTTLYNITAKLCELRNFVNKVPMLKSIAQSSLKQSNYSFECPMRIGVYGMDNMRIGQTNPLLAYLYRSRTSFMFQGGMYEQRPNKSLLALTTYKFIAKIIRRPC